MGILKPREGKLLARDHTAFLQQNTKGLLCHSLCLGTLGMNKSHKLQAHRDYTLVEEMGKSRKPEIVICVVKNMKYFSQADQERSLWEGATSAEA